MDDGERGGRGGDGQGEKPKKIGTMRKRKFLFEEAK